MKNDSMSIRKELIALKRSYRHIIRANIYLQDCKKDLEEENERLRKIIEEYENNIEIKDENVCLLDLL